MEIEKIIQHITPLFQTIITLVGLITTLWVVRGKTSIFINFLWKKHLKINIDVADKKLAKHIDEKLDFEILKMHFPNIKFKSINQAKHLLDWAKEKNVGPDEITRFYSGFIFNRKEPQNINFQLPKGTKTEKFSSKFLAILFLALLIAMLWAAPYSGFGKSILVKTAETNNYLFINKNRTLSNFALLLKNKNWIINDSNCNENLSSLGFSKIEISGLCKTISNDNEIKIYYEESIKDTSSILLIMVPVILVLLIYFIISYNRSRAIEDFEKEINGT